MGKTRTVDLRQNKRYQLKALVTFSWENSDGFYHYGEGQTRDISVHGVFVVTDKRLPLGSPLRLEVFLPALDDTSFGVCLRSGGKVIRAEEKGFAVVADIDFQIKFPETLTSENSFGRLRASGVRALDGQPGDQLQTRQGVSRTAR